MKRLVSLVLMAAMILSLVPARAGEPEKVRMGYIVIHNTTTNRVVNFRPKPGSTDYLDQLPEYRVVEILEDTTWGKVAWYKAKPYGSNTVGYLMAEFVQEMNDAERAEWELTKSQTYRPGQSAAPVSTQTPTPVPGSTIGPVASPVPASAAKGYIRTVLDKVNLRQTPGGTSLNENNQIPLGTVLAYYNVTRFGEYDWAQVNYDGKTGYVRSDCYKLCDASGNLLSGTNGTYTVVYKEGATYGHVTTDNVFFRKDTNMNGDFWARLPANWVLEVLGTEQKGNVTWYKVRGGTPTNPSRTYTGYVHGNFFALIDNPADTSTVTSPQSNYALITVDAVNLRQTPGGTPVTALAANTVVNIISKPAGNTADDWYYIEIGGKYGYVPATALKVLTEAELSSYTLPAAPASTPVAAEPATGSGYVKLILDKVNLRKTPGGTVLTPKSADKLPVGTVLAYTAGPTQADNYSWVLVTYNGITGYVRSDCWTYCDAAGNVVKAPTQTPVPVSTPVATPAGPSGSTVVGYIKLVKGGVNVRVKPWGTSLGQLPKDTVLPYYGTAIASGSELWYLVYSNQFGAFGYVLGDMATVVSQNNPAASTTTPPVTTGYVATTASSVWLRLKPDANAETAGQVKAKGTVLAMTGSPVANGAYVWYPVVTAEGVKAYLRGDFVFQLADWQLEAYKSTGVVPSPTPGAPTPRSGNSNYITILTDKVWVREKPSTQAGTLGQVNKGAILPFTKTEKVGQITWYRVTYNGKTAYIHGNFARVLTNAEYDAIRGTSTPAPTVQTLAPNTTPNTTDLSDLAMTTMDKVIIRKDPSMQGRELTTVRTKGTMLTYLGNFQAPTANNPYYWFNIRYGTITGWMRGDLIRVLTTEEKKLYQQTSNPDAPKEAMYRTLSKNDTGTDVTALQQKLVEKGFLTADQVSGTYLTSTETAVINFQKANGLTVDGIAGEKTQHALFGTVPVGTYDGSSTTVTLYPVEKIDWYTGGIQSIWGVGVVAVITDVYTGISFKAQRLYGDNHADCEPLTTADTAAICQIYGVSNAQEISDREKELESWRRRPLWVTVGGRTFAASMYGIPHNFKGDRIPDNNYNGQFCVHFTNSRTHNTDHVDVDASYNGWFGAVSAIEYAYTHSKSGTK